MLFALFTVKLRLKPKETFPNIHFFIHSNPIRSKSVNITYIIKKKGKWLSQLVKGRRKMYDEFMFLF